MYIKHCKNKNTKFFATFAILKGCFTSGKMNVYLKWVIYVEEM